MYIARMHQIKESIIYIPSSTFHFNHHLQNELIYHRMKREKTAQTHIFALLMFLLLLWRFEVRIFLRVCCFIGQITDFV